MKTPAGTALATLLSWTLAALAVAIAARGPVPGPRSDSAAFVWIPAGTFLMGSPLGETGRDPGEVQHPVALSGFWLGRCPVTQKEWRRVMAGNPSLFRGSDQLPVEGVTWYDAVAYCNLRSLQEGRTPCYTLEGAGMDPRRWPRGWKQAAHNRIVCDWQADGYRLPTEAEWEYACRAGTTTATAFGPSLTSRQANFNGTEPYGTSEIGPDLRRTLPVGSYPPNAWGLHDMHGNISQWCWDWAGDYARGPQVDPRGPTGPATRRVHRGGSWFSHGVDLRSAARFSDAPHFRLDMLPGGFRVVRGGTGP